VNARDPRFTKQAIERRAFEALAPLIGWDVVPGSIQQPDPPQPDILCEVTGRGAVAVELVALDDDETRRRLAFMSSTRPAWDDAMAKWPAPEREVLQADLGDAYISLDFFNDAGRQARTAALYAVQGYLKAHPRFAGKIDPESLGEPDGFASAQVFRGSVSAGPHLSSPSGGSWQWPNLEKIVEKLRDKTYTTTAPLELFAYTLYDEADLHMNSLPAIQDAVAQHLPGSQFGRVHVFHVGHRRHIWSSGGS
jgi:hypothetical protein